VVVRLALLGAFVALLGAGGASAARVELRCASMPLEQALPAPLARAAAAFSPWVGRATGLAGGPVYLVAGSYRTAVSRDGDPTDSSGAYLHRALIAVAPSYTGRVVVSGGALRFSTDGASRCTVKGNEVSCTTPTLSFARTLALPAGGGWRIVRTELRLPATGCYRVTAVGGGLRETIPLAVP
jgi:hypothetical protein